MAWTKTSAGDYLILTETDLVIDDNEGDSAEVVTVSSVIPSEFYDWENKKFPLTVDMTTAAGAGATIDAILQVSTGDATTGDVMGDSSATPLWVDAATIDINVTANTTTSYSKIVDATDVYAPYARIALKTDATELTDAAGRCTVVLTVKNSNAGMPSGDFGGIGADPS